MRYTRGMNASRGICALILLAFTAACSAASTDRSGALELGSDALPWPAKDAPSQLFPGMSLRLRDVVSAADVGRSYSVASDRMPFSNTYWPFSGNGIDFDWSGEGSPLAKYMRFFDPTREARAREWEQQHHGTGVQDLQDWFGHCNGWSAAATAVAPPLHPVSVRIEGDTVLRCDDAEAGCTRFEVADIHALLTEVYLDGPQRVLGDRCERSPADIRRDAYGRVLNAGCAGVNPGTLMAVLAKRVRDQKLPFVMSVQTADTTQQIWNQPVAGYTVYKYQPLTRSQAVSLVSAGRARSYAWNPSAAGWVRVDVGVRYVTESYPSMTPVSGASQWDELRFSSVLELTGPTYGSNTRIVGGEYLDLPSSFANRLRVPPFIWLADGPGPAIVAESSTSTHNPLLNPSLVQFLAEEARK